MKLQRAVRDNQSSKYTSVKLLLILPYPTNPDAKPRELSRVSSLRMNTVNPSLGELCLASEPMAALG